MAYPCPLFDLPYIFKFDLLSNYHHDIIFYYVFPWLWIPKNLDLIHHGCRAFGSTFVKHWLAQLSYGASLGTSENIQGHFQGVPYRSPWRYWQSDNGRWSVFVSMLRALAILGSNSFTRSIGVRPELDTRSSGWALRYHYTLKVECWLIEDLHRDEQSIVIPRQVSNSNLRRRTWTNTSSLLVVAWVRYICGLCFSRRSLVSVRSHRLLVLFSYTHVTF